MRRVALVLLLVIVPSICLANPDGPVGSIIVTPRYAFSTDSQSAQTKAVESVSGGFLPTQDDQMAWEAGASLLVPTTRFMTLGITAMYGRRPGTSGVSDRNGEPALTSNIGAVIEFEARFYIPLTRDAREKIKSWDKPR